MRPGSPLGRYNYVSPVRGAMALSDLKLEGRYATVHVYTNSMALIMTSLTHCSFESSQHCIRPPRCAISLASMCIHGVDSERCKWALVSPRQHPVVSLLCESFLGRFVESWRPTQTHNCVITGWNQMFCHQFSTDPPKDMRPWIWHYLALSRSGLLGTLSGHCPDDFDLSLAFFGDGVNFLVEHHIIR